MTATISRRSLVKTSAISGLALASSAFTLPFSRIAHAADGLSPAPVEEKAVWSSCTVNCGSRCLLRLHVKDDAVYWSSPTPPAMTSTAIIRCGPACADARSVAV